MTGHEELDLAILTALRSRAKLATYVVRNTLDRSDPATGEPSRFRSVTTARVRYRLKRLEAAGRVRSHRGNYAVMIEWSLAPEPETTAHG